jgi:membrane-associated phospholipid phosphatase
MAVTFSRFVSTVLSPMTNPVITFPLLLGYADRGGGRGGLWVLIAAIVFSTVLPLAYLVWLRAAGKVRTMDIDRKANRIRPLAVGILSYLAGFIILLVLQAPNLAAGLMFCYATNTLIVALITRYWKISIHAIGISGPLVALNFHFGWIMVPFYALILVVSTARVILGRHTIPQVVAGGAFGLLATAMQLYFLFI